jgi:hypothetical protein
MIAFHPEYTNSRAHPRHAKTAENAQRIFYPIWAACDQGFEEIKTFATLTEGHLPRNSVKR